MANAGSAIISLVPTILAIGLLAAVVRSFGGKEFKLSSTHKSKALANKKSKMLQDNGFITRVTKKDKKHQVWSRDESAFGAF